MATRDDPTGTDTCPRNDRLQDEFERSGADSAPLSDTSIADQGGGVERFRRAFDSACVGCVGVEAKEPEALQRFSRCGDSGDRLNVPFRCQRHQAGRSARGFAAPPTTSGGTARTC